MLTGGVSPAAGIRRRACTMAQPKETCEDISKSFLTRTFQWDDRLFKGPLKQELNRLAPFVDFSNQSSRRFPGRRNEVEEFLSDRTSVDHVPERIGIQEGPVPQSLSRGTQGSRARTVLSSRYGHCPSTPRRHEKPEEASYSRRSCSVTPEFGREPSREERRQNIQATDSTP